MSLREITMRKSLAMCDICRMMKPLFHCAQKLSQHKTQTSRSVLNYSHIVDNMCNNCMVHFVRPNFAKEHYRNSIL